MYTMESDPIIEHGASANSLNHVPDLQNGHSALSAQAFQG